MRARTFFVAAGITAIIFTSFRDVQSQGYIYESRGKRDPFTPLIGQGKVKATVDLEDVASIAEIRLEGIAINAKGKTTAIMNGALLKEGDNVGIVKVIKIGKKSVIISMGGKEYTVDIASEEGGLKGG